LISASPPHTDASVIPALVAAIVLLAFVVWRLTRRRGHARYGRVAQPGRYEADDMRRETADVEAPQATGAPPPTPTVIEFRGGPVSEAQVVGALRECYDPEIPIDIYELGLVYGVDIDADAIAVRMTLTSRDCPSARSIPEDVKRRIAALGQSNVNVEIVWDPPWHPSRISAEGKQKLGLA
jgi:metal-sulfur cluster biosynthetic enzyme